MPDFWAVTAINKKLHFPAIINLNHVAGAVPYDGGKPTLPPIILYLPGGRSLIVDATLEEFAAKIKSLRSES